MPKLIKNLFGNNKGVVNIQRECYAMTSTDGDHAEITMYGVIVQKHPRDWWTGEKIEGDYIALDDFMEDLDQLSAAKTITIRMNSPGGEVYAALPIHNRLRELKAKITVIVDGIAMSAASFIMCAADTVKLSESTIIMIHKSAIFVWWDWYTADDLRRDAEMLDTVDKALVSAYVRKTKMSEEDLLSMMSDETYMTGKEAIDKGFADELLEDGEPLKIAASADRRTLYFNDKPMDVARILSGLPENIPTVTPEAEPEGPVPVETNNNKPAPSGGNEGGNSMPKSMEELRKENPKLAEELMAEAQAAAKAELADDVSNAGADERKRLQEIDELLALFDDETIKEAKYGENACTAQEMTHRAAIKAAKEGKSFMSDLTADAESSGAAGVPATAGGNTTETKAKTEEEKEAEAKAQVAEILGKKKKED